MRLLVLVVVDVMSTDYRLTSNKTLYLDTHHLHD